jgi:[ribosomal protein S5]-alanine N-acetyltransferase
MLTIDLSFFPSASSDRLTLRMLGASDADQLFALRSDPIVMLHVDRPLANTVDDAAALIGKVGAGIANNESIHWAITEKGNDALIGLIGFWRIVKEHHYAELGYMLAPSHWGRGIMSEAIGVMLPVGFGTLGLHRVEAITRPQNIASIRALEKNRFVREGHFREDTFWNGAYHDSLHFGRLNW